MPYRIGISRAAAKQAKVLPTSTRQRVRRAVEALADEPRPHGVKTLSGKKTLHRVRVGLVRIVCQVQNARLMALVIRIGDRN